MGGIIYLELRLCVCVWGGHLEVRGGCIIDPEVKLEGGGYPEMRLWEGGIYPVVRVDVGNYLP